MQLKLYYILSDLFANTIRTLLFLPIGMVGLHLGIRSGLSVSLLLMAIILIISIGCSLIRELISKIGVFFLLHLALAGLAVGAAFLFSSLIFTLIVIVYTVFELIMSIYQRLRPARLPENTSLLMMVPFFAALLVTSYFKVTGFELPLALMFGACVLMYTFNIYLLNFIKYSKVDSHKTSVPYETITGTYHMLLGMFGIIAVAAMLIARFIPMGNILGSLGNALLTFIRAIVRFFSKDKEPDADILIEESMPQMPTSAVPEGMGDGGTSPFWAFLEKILMVIIPIAIIVAVVGGVIYAIYRIYKMFYDKNMAVGDTTETILVADKKEQIKHPEFSFRELVKRFSAKTPSERIRKEFIRLVEETNKRDGVNPSLTPRELLNKPEKNGAEQLAALYSQARYSNTECTKDEANTFKELCKKY